MQVPTTLRLTTTGVTLKLLMEANRSFSGLKMSRFLNSLERLSPLFPNRSEFVTNLG